MTLPDERFRSVIAAKNFMADLLDPKKTPRVPKEVRQRAYSILRHYPSYWDLERVSDKSPEVFQPQIEPLTRMVMQYNQDKKEIND
jgi:hypothetical protein